MAYDKIVQDNQNLVKFWDQVFTELPEEETELTEDEDSFKELAPSEKLFEAACTLGHKKKVLDFGCGTAWASIIAAKSGCKDVTAVDAAPGAVKAAQTYSSRYGMESSIHLACGGLDFLQSVPSDTYDGIICSMIYHHDDKHVTDSPMDEVLKDADVIHHCFHDLSKPVKEKEKTRYEALVREFGLDSRN